jgi:hypothetical protein
LKRRWTETAGSWVSRACWSPSIRSGR